MRWHAAAIGLVALVGLAVPAGALPADKHLTLEADNGQGCAPQAKADCFRVTNGSLDGFRQGQRVHVTMVNVGSAPHNVFAARSADADDNNVDTPADAAINGSATVDGGEETSLVFRVPDDAEGLYLWCEVDNHETFGMWLEASVEPAANDDDGGNDAPEEGENRTGNETGNDSGGSDGGPGGSEEGGDSSIPAPGALAATLAGLAAALAAARTRRTA